MKHLYGRLLPGLYELGLDVKVDAEFAQGDVHFPVTSRVPYMSSVFSGKLYNQW